MGFAELIFTSLIRISAIDPKSKHYVTFATPRDVPVRRVKAFICRKVVPLVRVTLPAEVRQLGWASCLTSAGRVTLESGTTFLHINALARLIGTTLGVASAT